MRNRDRKPNTSAPHFSAAIRRWRGGLSQVTGCSTGEIDERTDILLRFCAAHALSPEAIIIECRLGSERMARRSFYLRLARESEANLVVQSFLVHNGINVFGELVCMPATAEGIEREQGRQWRSRRS